MTRRIALASIYTLFVVALLLTWPWGEPGPQIDGTILAGSVVLFVACFVFILHQDMGGRLCLWHSGNCGRAGWF